LGWPSGLCALSASADPKEDALRAALVGKYVTVKIDMPAVTRASTCASTRKSRST
jgi:hypothetical protein